jgi:hypothetical protein
MTSKTQEPQIGIGTRVSYEDMANPLREGEIVGEVAGQWAIVWDTEGDDLDSALIQAPGSDVAFHTTVTKHMLANAVERQRRFQSEQGGRIGGWDAKPTWSDIRMGDTVRLRSGEEVVADGIVTSVHDAEGVHAGPFLSVAGDHRRRTLLSEVVAIVGRNERRCTICGNGVTSTNPETTFCRGCFYTGAAYEAMLSSDERNVLLRIGALDGVKDTAVWHTGGGCFNLGIRLDDGRLLTPSVGLPAEDGSDEVYPEPGIPTGDERWCLVIAASEEAWDEWREEDISVAKRLFDDDELVEAVAATVRGEEVA